MTAPDRTGDRCEHGETWRCDRCGFDGPPDRPGDRDQQQAAGLTHEQADVLGAAVRDALAAARAEEAARWQAKIEALIARYVELSRIDRDGVRADQAERFASNLRALLDGEQPDTLTRDVYGCACDNPSPSCRGWVTCNRGQDS